MPKLALYYVDNHKIEIVKTFFGKEKVVLNGRTISEKAAKNSTEHTFSINQNNYRITRRKGSQAIKMNAYEVFKDSSPIALTNVVQQSATEIFLLIIAIGIGCGFIFGLFIYKFLFPVEV